MDDNIENQFSMRGLNKCLKINEPVRCSTDNLNKSSETQLKAIIRFRNDKVS